jgi:uncharacterized membrane protein
MLANLDYLRDRLHQSFWVVPGAMAIAAIIAAPGMLWLDTTPVGVATGQWPAPSAVGADGADLLLSTIAGSMITVASLVFSMTLVALTLAASSIGTRLLDNYIARRVNQVALGLFLATFLYSLIVLRAVIDDRSTTFVPHLSVSFAMLLLRGSGRCSLRCDPPGCSRQRRGLDPAARKPDHARHLRSHCRRARRSRAARQADHRRCAARDRE